MQTNDEIVTLPSWQKYGLSKKNKQISIYDKNKKKHEENDLLSIDAIKPPTPIKKRTKGMFCDEIKPDTSKATDKKWIRLANPKYYMESNAFKNKEKDMLQKRKIQQTLLDTMVKEKVAQLYKKQKR